MLALCLMLSVTCYAQNDAGIIGWSLILLVNSGAVKASIKPNQHVNTQ